MGKKTPKTMKKFVKSGQLKTTIENRKKHQQMKKKMESRRGASTKAKGGGKGKGKDAEAQSDEEESGLEDDEEEPEKARPSNKKGCVHKISAKLILTWPLAEK